VRRLAIALLMAPLAGLVGVSLLSPPAQVAAQPPADTGSDGTGSDGTGSDGTDAASGLAPVDVLEVSGLFDDVTVDSIISAIGDAQEAGSQALVLQLNTRGAVVGDGRMGELLAAVRDAEIGIGLWVGPSRGSRAIGTPAQLFCVADVSGMVAGARMGYLGELLPEAGDCPGAEVARNTSLGYREARAAGLLRYGGPADLDVPVVRSMVAAMDGVELENGTVLDTITQQLDDEGNTQSMSTLVRFRALGLLDQLFHTVASPPIAYLFFVIGLCLLIFEFFTAGVGVAGLVGAALTFLGTYGLTALPARPGAVALLVVAMVAFAIDVQVGVPRFWTGVGVVTFVLGSWFLYDDLPGASLRLSWITLAVGIIGVMLTFIVGMPSMVRTRFATPTIGREWMIGTEGVAVDAISPEGIAQVGNAKWRARTNRATPIAAGDSFKVVAIDGVTLEVEPLEGAARDYRERRSKRETADSDTADSDTADSDTGDSEPTEA